MGDSIFPNINRIFNDICKIFCDIYSLIFNLGNYILFLWFLYLFYKLYIGVRDKEEDEKLYSYKLKRLKKHGRIGMFVCIIIGFLFLTKIMGIFIEMIGKELPAPMLIGLLPSSYSDYIDGFFLYTYSIISFMCFILFTFGVYLLIYNNKILHTKWKASHLLIIGIIGLTLFGLAMPFHIMNGMIIELDYPTGYS